MGFSYTFSISDAVRREQENLSHSGSLNYSRSILPLLSGNAGYSFSFLDFPNEDALGRTREIINHTFSAGLSYFVGPRFSLNATYFFQISNTNLSALPAELEELLADWTGWVWLGWAQNPPRVLRSLIWHSWSFS